MIRLTAELTPAGTSYLATGQGQPVVLIHGVGLNKEMWSRNAKQFDLVRSARRCFPVAWITAFAER